MKRLSWRLFLVLLVSIAIVTPAAIDCERSRPTKHPSKKHELAKDPAIVEPLYRFTVRLFKSMREAKKNLIFSPLSIQSALNMLSLGVTDGSQTEKDLIETLGYANMSTSPLERHKKNRKLKKMFKSITAEGIEKKDSKSFKPTVLDMINVAIVKDARIKKEYLRSTKKYYQAIVRQMKDKSDKKKILDKVNKWGKKAGFSSDILDAEDVNDGALTLVNAVRAEAYWFRQFWEAEIGELFYNHGRAEGLVKNATGLAVKDSDVHYVEFTKNEKSAHRERNLEARAKNPTHYDELAGLEFRAIDIGLSGGVSYTIIEPLSSSSGDELAKLEDELMKFDAKDSATRLTKLTDILDKTDRVAADIQMPGFKFEQDIDLKKHLKSIGLGRIFDKDTADLGKMVDEASVKKTFVKKAKHKAMIEVAKNGIKAAAVTKIEIVIESMPPEPIIVDIKNPYFFLIRLHKVPMFAGHLVSVQNGKQTGDE